MLELLLNGFLKVKSFQKKLFPPKAIFTAQLANLGRIDFLQKEWLDQTWLYQCGFILKRLEDTLEQAQGIRVHHILDKFWVYSKEGRHFTGVIGWADGHLNFMRWKRIWSPKATGITLKLRGNFIIFAESFIENRQRLPRSNGWLVKLWWN